MLGSCQWGKGNKDEHHKMSGQTLKINYQFVKLFY